MLFTPRRLFFDFLKLAFSANRIWSGDLVVNIMPPLVCFDAISGLKM